MTLNLHKVSVVLTGSRESDPKIPLEATKNDDGVNWTLTFVPEVRVQTSFVLIIAVLETWQLSNCFLSHISRRRLRSKCNPRFHAKKSYRATKRKIINSVLNFFPEKIDESTSTLFDKNFARSPEETGQQTKRTRSPSMWRDCL